MSIVGDIIGLAVAAYVVLWFFTVTIPITVGAIAMTVRLVVPVVAAGVRRVTRPRSVVPAARVRRVKAAQRPAS